MEPPENPISAPFEMYPQPPSLVQTTTLSRLDYCSCLLLPRSFSSTPGGWGGGLFNRKLHYVIPSPLVAPPLSKARSCTIQPCISSPPTRPPFTLLHTGPLTVSWDYQAHPHLRTFALTVSRFRNGLALNGRMAHFLYIFTYVDFSIKIFLSTRSQTSTHANASYPPVLCQISSSAFVQNAVYFIFFAVSPINPSSP